MDKLDSLVAEVRKIAVERPDTIYCGGPCYYDSGECNDGSVGCLIGQALSAVDWSIYNPGQDSTISVLLGVKGFEGSRVDWCRRVQQMQDNGRTWGECITYADEWKEYQDGQT